MEIEEQKKIEQISILITIDGIEFKTNALDVFFLYRGIEIYSKHTRLKNFLKTVMDKQLNKINTETPKQIIRRIENEVAKKFEDVPKNG